MGKLKANELKAIRCWALYMLVAGVRCDSRPLALYFTRAEAEATAKRFMATDRRAVPNPPTTYLVRRVEVRPL